MRHTISTRRAIRVAATFAALLAAFAVLAPGCTQPEPEPVVEPPPPPPPPKTAQQLAQEWQGDLLALYAPGSVLNETQIRQIVEGLKSKARPEPWGQQGLNILSGEVKNQLDSAFSQAESSKDRAQWQRVLMLCTALDMFEPENARTARIRQTAEHEMNRPVVTIKSWTETNGETYVTLELTVPGKDPEIIDVRKGEEFNNLRMVDIIGNRSGVLLEYTPTKQTFEVMTRR